MAVLNAALDVALDHRVELHQDRAERVIDEASYLAGLKAVRDVEYALEPKRRALGAGCSRAFETATSRDDVRQDVGGKS